MQFGRYVLLERLGRGGMGEVFRARDQDTGREVALKRIKADLAASPQLRDRFRREAEAAKRLSHPNVVRTHEAGEIDGTSFLAMELLVGDDLAALVERRGPLPMAEAAEYVRQACLGMQHAHEMGIVHRDLKPSNLWLTPTGQVKVLDLGLAKVYGATSLTESDRFMGTLDYVAPEQVTDAHNVDVRADVYSLGCTLYHLLTGRAPFHEAAPGARPMMHQSVEPTPLERFRPDVPPRLAAVVRRMMNKQREWRHQTPGEAAAALAEAFAEPTLPVELAPFTLPPTPVTPVARRPRRRRFAFVAAGVALVGVLAGLLYWVLSPGPDLGEKYDNDLGMTLWRIPRGRFLMGSPEGEAGRDGHERQHEVTISRDFYLGAREVTQKQYALVMGKAPSWFSGTGGGKDAVEGTNTDDFPVESVSYDDAVSFCERLTQREKEKLKGWTYRLPSEAEWEYACRAGTSTPYSFAQKEIGDYAWTAADSGGRPRPAGNKKANAWGLHDMHGNVWEWVADAYDLEYYPAGGATDPKGPPANAGRVRVFRGGSWKDDAANCRSAWRSGGLPSERFDRGGFRVALSRR